MHNYSGGISTVGFPVFSKPQKLSQFLRKSIELIKKMPAFCLTPIKFLEDLFFSN